MSRGYEFHEFLSHWNIQRRIAKFDTPVGRRAKTIVDQGIDYFHCWLVDASVRAGGESGEMNWAAVEGRLIEHLWYIHGQPYYRVFPEYADMFGRTTLDVPCELLRAPYPSISLRFAKGAEPRFGRLAVTDVFLSVLTAAGIREIGARARRLPGHSHLTAFFEKLADRWDDEYDETRRYQLLVACEEPEPVETGLPADAFDDVPGHIGIGDRGRVFRSSGRLTPGRKVEEIAIAATTDPKAEIPDEHREDWQGAIDFATRVALSVCFLATGGDRLVEPDVLNKDFNAYLDAVNAKRLDEVKRLHDKATKVREGAVGYTVGKADAILGRRAYDVDTTATTDEKGRELKYRHYRQPHWQTFWTGKGRTTPVVRFIRLLVIRPDLPPPPEEPRRGYRTLKKKVQPREETDRGEGQPDPAPGVQAEPDLSHP